VNDPLESASESKGTAPYPQSVRGLHWALVALICAQLATISLRLPLQSHQVQAAVLAIRTQIEFLMLLTVLAYVGVGIRLKRSGYVAPAHHPRPVRILHIALLLLMGLLPLLGIAAAWARGEDLRFLGLVPVPPLVPVGAQASATFEALHNALGAAGLLLLAAHVARILALQVVGKQPVLQRMLPPPATRRLVNRVPLLGQLCLCFGLMLAMLVGAGLYTASQYRALNDSRAQFDAQDVASLEEMRSAQATLIVALVSARSAQIDEATTHATVSLEQVALRLPNGQVRNGVSEAAHIIRARLAGDRSREHVQLAMHALAEAVETQAAEVSKKRQAIEDAAATGFDLILLMVGIAVNLSLVMAYLLSRSLLGGIAAARRMISSIEEESQSATIDIHGKGEFAVLVRDVVRARDTVASRLGESHRARAEVARQASARELEINSRNAAEQEQVVREIARALSALAAGHLDHRITASFPGDYDRIRDNFNQTIAQLQAAMATIARSSEAIGSSSQNVAQEANSLATRSRRQTATVSDMAFALDRMTAEVKAAADGATRGAEAVGSVRTAAENSGKVVSKAVQAMDDIEKSSARIVEIIGVIDTFASRSNLLALNARIEAARAGESGRGFAVVAQEVHSLARRAAQAAREIRGLVAESSRHVGTGVMLVQETGAVLQQIVGEIGQVDRLVAGVATSAHDQAARLVRVNGEMRQLDRIGHENTAMVGQTTAALQSIRDNAATLDGLIRRMVHSDEPHSERQAAEVIPMLRRSA
jgi:methyl-accepting chemotaxis protein/cytochrome b561